ncbi:hypothetical protein BVL54_16755 [Bacillus paralicheniformis]|nr:hypothetical protein BVL54_16755 [Bacillus paralicheniformis]
MTIILIARILDRKKVLWRKYEMMYESNKVCLLSINAPYITKVFFVNSIKNISPFTMFGQYGILFIKVNLRLNCFVKIEKNASGTTPFFKTSFCCFS